MKIEFLKYTPTPQAKFIGLAEVLIEGKLLLRYKIAPGKEKGYFIQPASYCIESPAGNEYKPCFAWDSNILKDEIESIIRKHVNAAGSKPAQNASVFQNDQNEERVPF